LVGFALETEDEIEGGKRKLVDKDLDLVMVNNPLRKGSEFGGETNGGHLIFRDGRVEDIPPVTKLDLAEKIFDAVSSHLGGAA
jgi:phosphopantothenoylcysteine decarboxylase/phosphopantothenate--cysteine ligase